MIFSVATWWRCEGEDSSFSRKLIVITVVIVIIGWQVLCFKCMKSRMSSSEVVTDEDPWRIFPELMGNSGGSVDDYLAPNDVVNNHASPRTELPETPSETPTTNDSSFEGANRKRNSVGGSPTTTPDSLPNQVQYPRPP